MSNTRTYQRFIPQVDNSYDTIQAEDINELQRAIEKLQEESFTQADNNFLNRCLFSLEHHPDVNSMMVDLLEDGLKFNQSFMLQTQYDESIKSIVMSGSGEGMAATYPISNPTGNSLMKLVLLVDEHRPEGTSISYEISYDNITYHSIQANKAVPIQPPGEQAQFYFRARFSKEESAEDPRIDAWAILYYDPAHDVEFLEDGMSGGAAIK